MLPGAWVYSSWLAILNGREKFNFPDIVSCVYLWTFCFVLGAWIRFFIYDSLLQPSHLEVINENYMHSVPKSEHNENHHLSLPWVYISWVSFDFGRRVSVYMLLCFTVCTQTQRHTSRWWSCQKHLKECRYWRYAEYKIIASFSELPHFQFWWLFAVYKNYKW